MRAPMYDELWVGGKCMDKLEPVVADRGENGMERCRVRVTLATGIPREICTEINLGYRDPAAINPQGFANREDEGVLLVPKAGEMLYHLRQRPAWAREM